MNAQEIGIAAMLLGAGRAKKTDTIDPVVGLVMKKRVGDKFKKASRSHSFMSTIPRSSNCLLQPLSRPFTYHRSMWTPANGVRGGHSARSQRVLIKRNKYHTKHPRFVDLFKRSGGIFIV